MSFKPFTFGAHQQSYEQEDDTVHFSPNSSSHSWAGHVNEEEDMPEDDVREYISSNDPKLFQKLCGLPLSSSDIPLSFYGQRTLHHLGRDGAEPRFQHGYYAPLPRLPVQSASTHMQNATIARQYGRSHAVALTVKAKERIEHKLVNGYALYQRELSPSEAPLPCDFALCIGELHNSTKLQYYVIEYDHARSTPSKALVSNATDYYCNGCFDTIFTIGEQENIPPTVSNAPDRLLLDGIDHEDVMHAVARLYPDVQPGNYSSTSFLDKYGRPDQAFNWPSNSPENCVRRAYKQHETEKTLAEVTKYEKAILNERSEAHHNLTREPSPDASVLITRPAYMEPKQDRYKKQGHTRHNWHKYSKEKRQSESLNDTQPNTPLASPIKLPDQFQERFCYCREIDDGTEVLKCSSELCPIGWFHLQCTDLECLPAIHEQFLCCYCSGRTDDFVTRHLSDEDTSSLTEPSTPLRDDSVPGHFEDEKGDNGMGAEEEEQDADRVDDDAGSILENSRPNEEGIKWPAVNEPDATQAVTCLTGLSDNSTDLSCINSSEAELGDEGNLRASQALEEHDVSATRSSSLVGVGTCSLLSPTISDPASDNDQASQATTAAPVTPPLQPVHLATKPWGTPINLNKLNIFDPSSPSPNRKRKRESTREHFEDGIRVDSEILDSEDEGEEVPLMLDLQVLRNCNG